MTSEFGSLLRQLRLAAGLTQEALAERAGVSREAIGSLEAGRRTRPRPETVALIAKGIAATPSQHTALRDAVPGSEPGSGQLRLPADAAVLIGRDDVLASYEQYLRPSDGRLAPPVLCLHGGAGVGKSATAVHLSHRVAGDYPSGRLFLRMQNPDGTRVPPEEALDRLLRRLGVAAERVPDDLDQRTALFRAVVHDQRLLLVYDDVLDDDQISPLLPAAPGCGVVITSRRPVLTLVQKINPPLEPLSESGALRLLDQLTHGRLPQDHPATAAIVRYCGGLPLALRIIGLQLAARKDDLVEHLAEVAARLSDEHSRLDLLTSGELTFRTSLNLTLQAADDSCRALFARLSVVEADHVSAWVAAALLDCPETRAEQVLERLVDLGLLQIHSLGRSPRYTMHSLIRAGAVELLAPDDADVAVDRFLRAALWLAVRADEGVPHGLPLGSIGLDEIAGPELPATERLAASDPLGWFDTELAVLRAAVELACRSRRPRQAGMLAVALEGYLTVNDLHQLRLDLLTSAVEVVRGRSFPLLEARLDHGIFAAALRRSGSALDQLAAAAAASAEASGDARLIWNAYRQSGLNALSAGRVQDARHAVRRAFDVLEANPHEPHELTGPLRLAGIVEGLAGEHAAAVGMLRRAAGLHTEPTRARAITLADLVDALIDVDAIDEAAASVQEAREIVTTLDDPHGHAQVDRIEARVAIRQRRWADAEKLLARASTAFAEQEAPKALHDVEIAQAELELTRGRPEAARELLHRSLATAQRSGNATGVLRCRRWLTECEAQTARRITP
jgi:transcriptional regulator with XRE-family HTH domain/tetratricopeptide (TPR) repeat protein